MRHMEDERLLRYADGELPAREARQVRTHLEACWECRAELEELQETVKECVRYRKSVLQEHLPPPPAPWADIYRQFEELDAVPAGSRWGRMARVLAFPARWVPAAIAAALVCGLVLYEWQDTPTVEAAALLRKAVAASGERPAVPRRVRLRTSRQQASRVIGGAPAAAVKASADPALDDIERMFERANYSWDDPLSARSFQAWREQLPAKHDEVATIDDCYRIRTTTEAGEVKEATLKLRMADLQPVEGRLEFRDNEWVEISEMVEAPAEPTVPDAVASAGLPAAPGPVQPPVAARRAATLGRELQVMAALHQVGADLGDPIEVTRAAGQILVSGVGIAPERQRQIHGALDAMPDVLVRFVEPGEAVPPPSERAAAEVAASGEVLSLHARLAEQVGGRPHFEQLSAQLLDASEAMMSRAYALRRLAQRFPPESERELGARERRLLRDLGREHASALFTQSAAMEKMLAPVLVSLGGRAVTAPRAIQPASWQLGAEDLFHAARQMEKLLAMILGAAPGDVPAGELPSQLLAAMARVRTDAEALERLTAEDIGAQGR